MPNFNSFSDNVRAKGIYDETCHVSKTSAFRGFVTVGAYSFVGERCWLSNVLVGKFSWIENGVELGVKKLFPGSFSNHSFSLSEGDYLFPFDEYKKLTTDRFFFHKQPLTYVGNDVRICKGGVVFSGVKIGDGALVLPNSVVYDDIEPYSIVAGNPAKVVGYRFDKSTIDRISSINWFDLDFSGLDFIRRKNYLDVDFIIKYIETSSLSRRCESYRVYDSFMRLDDVFDSKIAIQGPSHVYKWTKHIRNGDVPNFDGLLYGEVGVSLFSKSYRNFEDWWLGLGDNKLIFFVPDFRIGNADYCLGGDDGNGLFIYDNFISENIDSLIYSRAISLLDSLVSKYGNRIKFLFWCLYGREMSNIRDGKYVVNGVYRHPVWNYNDLVDRYSGNVLDVREVSENVFDIIDPDGSIHPNVCGFNLLADFFKNAMW